MEELGVILSEEVALIVDDSKWSNEEKWFRDWLVELVAAGYVESFSRPIEPFMLFPSVKVNYFDKKGKMKQHILHRETTYLPDFFVTFSEKARDILFFDESTIVLGKKPIFYGKSVHVEVKGGFVGNNNSDISAPIKMKAVFYLYKMVVNLVKVPNIFEDTFYPKSFMVTPSGAPKKDKKGVLKIFKGIEEF